MFLCTGTDSYLHAVLQETALADSGCQALVELALQRAVRGMHLRNLAGGPVRRPGGSEAGQCPVCQMDMDLAADYEGSEVWQWPFCQHNMHRDCHLQLMAASPQPRCPQCYIDYDGCLARRRCVHGQWSCERICVLTINGMEGGIAGLARCSAHGDPRQPACRMARGKGAATTARAHGRPAPREVRPCRPPEEGHPGTLGALCKTNGLPPLGTTGKQPGGATHLLRWSSKSSPDGRSRMCLQERPTFYTVRSNGAGRWHCASPPEPTERQQWLPPWQEKATSKNRPQLHC